MSLMTKNSRSSLGEIKPTFCLKSVEFSHFFNGFNEFEIITTLEKRKFVTMVSLAIEC